MSVLIIYSFNLNISPKMSYDVLERDFGVFSHYVFGHGRNSYFLNLWMTFISLYKFFENTEKQEVRERRKRRREEERNHIIFKNLIFFPRLE